MSQKLVLLHLFYKRIIRIENICFRRANALEQRLESVPNQMCSSAQQTSNMTKEEDSQMKETKTSDALNWVVKPKLAFLSALHVLVLVLSLVAHPPIETSAVRALP